MPECRSCGARMQWIRLPSGKLMPTDLLAVSRSPRPLDVLVQPDGSGFVVSERSVDAAQRAVDAGAGVLRESHWETCSGAARPRDGGINPNQETML